MWQDSALCLGDETFILRGGTAAKKQTCEDCPVKYECLKFAIENEDFEATVYGGFTGQERKHLVESGVVFS